MCNVQTYDVYRFQNNPTAAQHLMTASVLLSVVVRLLCWSLKMQMIYSNDSWRDNILYACVFVSQKESPILHDIHHIHHMTYFFPAPFFPSCTLHFPLPIT